MSDQTKEMTNKSAVSNHLNALLESEINDFLVTMRIVQAIHGRSSKAVRHTAKHMSNRFVHNDIINMCKSISSSALAYDRYLAIEKQIERGIAA